LSTHFL